MPSLPPMPRRLLRGFERVSVPTMEALHNSVMARRVLHGTLGRFNNAWIEATNGRLWDVRGFERVASLDAPSGVVLVSNHRSFFDMFVISSILNSRTPLLERVCYPVRSEFFYSNPLGLVLNVGVSGAAMWPPVFRDERRRELNPTGMDQLAASLTRGMAIGLHPEGKRNKSRDPYDFLPLKPGLGQLLERAPADTWVLPAFIAGLSNDIVREVGRGLRRQGEPVRVRFAEPMRAAELQALSDPMAMTTAVFARVRSEAVLDCAEFDPTRAPPTD